MKTTQELLKILSSNKREYSDRKEAAFELLNTGKKFATSRAAKKMSNVINSIRIKWWRLWASYTCYGRMR